MSRFSNSNSKTPNSRFNHSHLPTIGVGRQPKPNTNYPVGEPVTGQVNENSRKSTPPKSGLFSFSFVTSHNLEADSVRMRWQPACIEDGGKPNEPDIQMNPKKLKTLSEREVYYAGSLSNIGRFFVNQNRAGAEKRIRRSAIDLGNGDPLRLLEAE